MKRFLKPGLLALFMFLIVGCGTQSAVKPDELAGLKAENQKLQDQVNALNEKLMTLSAEESNSIAAKNEQLATYSNLIKSLKE